MNNLRKTLSTLVLVLILFNLRTDNIKLTSSEPMDDINVLTIIHPEVIPNEFTDVVNQLSSLGCNITYTGFVDAVQLNGQTFRRDITVSEVDVNDYDIFFMAGGWGARRIVESENCNETITLIQDLYYANVLMTSVCAGATLFVFADIINGTSLTAYAELAPEVEAAGGIYVDQSVVIDEPFVTAQGYFQSELVLAIAEVLGYYENESPTCVDAGIEYLGENEYNITVETADASPIQSVLLFIYRISDTNQTIFVQGVSLKQTNDEFAFSGIIGLALDSVYSFDVSITDWYRNTALESNVLRADTNLIVNGSSINFVFSIIGLTSLAVIIFLTRKKDNICN